MRLSLYVLMCFSLALAKDRNYKLHQGRDYTQITSRHGMNSQQNGGSMVSRSSRDDTSTVWLDDFEGDVSGWTVGEGWTRASNGVLLPLSGVMGELPDLDASDTETG